MQNQEKLLTLQEIAEVTGYSTGYLRKKKDNQEIPYYQNKKGEPIRFSLAEVLEAMRKNIK